MPINDLDAAAYTAQHAAMSIANQPGTASSYQYVDTAAAEAAKTKAAQIYQQGLDEYTTYPHIDAEDRDYVAAIVAHRRISREKTPPLVTGKGCIGRR